MKTQIRGIVIDPGQCPAIKRLPCTQTGLQAMAGGTLHRLPFAREFASLLYMPRSTKNAQPTRCYRGTWFYGRLMIVGWRNNNPTDLPLELAETLASRWKDIEVDEEKEL